MSWGNIKNWALGIIKFTDILAENNKLLAEVKEALDSPSRYKDDLEFIDKAYGIKLKLLTEQKDKLASSDSRKRTIIEELIKRISQAKENQEKLIEENERLIKEIEDFRRTYRKSSALRNLLNEQLEKNKLGSLPIHPLTMDDVKKAAENVSYHLWGRESPFKSSEEKQDKKNG